MKNRDLTPEEISTLKQLGIVGKTDQEVRQPILDKLKSLDVEDVDTDPIEDLISILSAFSEIEAPSDKKKGKVTIEEEDDEELEIPEVIEEEDDDVDQLKLAAKKPAKPAANVAKKKEASKSPIKKFAPDSKEELNELRKESKEKAKEEKAKKEVIAAAKPAPTGKRNFVDLKTNEDEIELAKERLVSQFEKRGYHVTWGKKILSFSTEGTVSGRKIFTLDDLKINADGTFNIWLGFNAFRLLKNDNKDIETIKSFLSEDCADRVTVYSSGLCYAKAVCDTELKDFLPDALLDFADSYLKKLDDKLQKNRKKMEEAISEK